MSKALQQLQKDPRWTSVEDALREYMTLNFINTTPKRDTEFNTIWELAENEGGKYHLLMFFRFIEDKAKEV